MSNTLWTHRQLARRAPGALLLVLAATLLAFGPAVAAGSAARAKTTPPTPSAQLVFDSPEKAADALEAAAKADDVPQLLKILGPEARAVLNSGDPVADNNTREDFVAAYETKHSIAPDKDNPAQSILVIGDNDWPLPMPIVKAGTGWRFDTAAGRQEILYRRIGENELDAIQVALAYVDAQRDYAAADPEGKGAHAYAEKLMSSPGKKDGLYWPSEEGQPESPIGDAVAEASSQGYTPGSGAPFHGYYYKILTGQGPAATEGEVDYIIHGKMIGGFALVAYPALYGNSGVMTFMVNYEGVVYQQDLGPATPWLAPRITRYNPESGWIKAEATSASNNQ